MAERIKTDLCVIGAGSGGLSIAAGASQMGADVVLLEKGKMGGDCLNYGCVPSKAILAAGKHAKMMSAGAPFGIKAQPLEVDFQRVHDHIHEVIATIEPNDSVERFRALGCNVIEEAGHFISPTEVQAGDTIIEAKRFVIATGSSPFVPPIPGLDEVPYFTNEDIFDNTELPEHLLIIGGGPIGIEMAQAHHRLGAKVTVLEGRSTFGKDDPELAAIVMERLRGEGIVIREGAMVERIAKGKGKQAISITIKVDGETEIISGSHLLLAVGRRPNLSGLGLDEGNIEFTDRAITVGKNLRSVSNKRVWAAGDVAGQYMFTHVAAYHAGIVIKSMLFRLPATSSMRAAPWVTYTDPELAHVGMTEAEAREQHSNINVLRFPFHENDRALAERRDEGLIKVVTEKNGRILGASIVGPGAGDLLQPWVLAITNKMKIGKMAGIIAPYPTMGEVSKRVAGSYFTPKLFSEKTRKIVRFLLRFA